MTISVIKLHTRERQITIVVNSAYRLVFICSLPTVFVSYSGISLFLHFPCPNFFFFLIFYILIFYSSFFHTRNGRNGQTHPLYQHLLYIHLIHPHFPSPHLPDTRIFCSRSSQSAVHNPQSTIRRSIRGDHREGKVIFFGFNPHRSFSIQCF